jgi:type I restriction enzyme S subunit
MSEWKEYKISELGRVITGKTPSSKNPEEWGNKVAFVTPTDFDSYNKSIEGSIRYLSERGAKVFNSKLLPPNSVIVTCIGSQMGKVALNKIPCVTNQQINSIILNENFNSDFIYYLISSMQDYLRNLATGGSTMPIVNKSDFENIKIIAPNLPIQTAIAEILSSLDDKIELNNKINQELENLAQTLFKQWFIDFEFPNENGEPYKSSGGEMVDSEMGEIPKGWRIGSIYDISSVIYGAPFKSSLFNQENKGLPLIRIRDLKTFKPQNWTEEVHIKGTKIQPGDLVVGMDAEFRPHFWLGQVGWLNQRVCLFKLKGGFSRLFVRETIRPSLEFFENSSVGTTVIHLGKGDIDTFKSILPDISKSELFAHLTEPLIDRIVCNSQENNSLINLRDTLLPKLISGELVVTDIMTEKQF